MTGKPRVKPKAARKRQLAPRTKSVVEGNKMERQRLDPMREAFDIQGYSPAEAISKFFPGRDDVPISALFQPEGITSGRFAAWGKTSADDGIFKPIIDLVSIRGFPADGGRKAVPATETYDLEAATIVNHMTGQHWYDVRLIPVVDSPNAAYFLDGRPLAEAFDTFVLGDPEVTPALSEAKRLCSRLGERILRRTFLDETSLLPLPFWASAFPMRFVVASIESDANEEARTAAKHLGFVFYEKIARFFDLLAAGRALADGVNSDTRQRIVVDEQAWKRRGFAIDVRSGDVIDTTAGRIEWRDVILRAPTPQPPSALVIRDAESAPKPVGAPRGPKERIAYLAALNRLFEQGDLETTAMSGSDLTHQIENALAELGYERPSESQIRRWLSEHLEGLWSRATGGA